MVTFVKLARLSGADVLLNVGQIAAVGEATEREAASVPNLIAGTVLVRVVGDANVYRIAGTLAEVVALLEQAGVDVLP